MNCKSLWLSLIELTCLLERRVEKTVGRKREVGVREKAVEVEETQ